jgi:hypothetical protein
MVGLWDMMDMAIAEELGVDLDTYVEVIEHKCTKEDRDSIILAVLGEDVDKIKEAKEKFNNYLNETTL